MKKISTIVFLLFSFGVFAQTPDEIFDKFYEATGGKNLWNEVKTYSITQNFKANAPTDYEMELNVSLENKSISKRKTILQKDFFYVINGSDAFLKIPLGSNDKKVKFDVKELPEKDKKALQDESQDYPIAFLDYEKKGYKATFKGLANGLNQVELAGSGVKHDLFFDAENGQLTKAVETLSSETITWEHKKYTKSKYGVSYPSESVYLSSKDKKKTTVTTEMSFNDTLEPTLFAK